VQVQRGLDGLERAGEVEIAGASYTGLPPSMISVPTWPGHRPGELGDRAQVARRSPSGSST